MPTTEDASSEIKEDLGYLYGWFFTMVPLLALIYLITNLIRGYSRKAFQVFITPVVTYFFWGVIVLIIKEAPHTIKGICGLIMIITPIIVLYFLRKSDWPN